MQHSTAHRTRKLTPEEVWKVSCNMRYLRCIFFWLKRLLDGKKVGKGIWGEESTYAELWPLKILLFFFFRKLGCSVTVLVIVLQKKHINRF